MLEEGKYTQKEKRIITWLMRQPKGFKFTASEISKRLDLESSYIGNALKWLPHVKHCEEQNTNPVTWEVC